MASRAELPSAILAIDATHAGVFAEALNSRVVTSPSTVTRRAEFGFRVGVRRRVQAVA